MAAKKKIQEVKDNNIDKIDSLIAKINSELKNGKISRASDIEGLFLLRCPTGITSLDIEIGGGFPARAVTQLVGAENSGKTALAFLACKGIQQTYGEDSRIALLMVEKFDKGFAKSLGFHVGYSDKEIEHLSKAHNMQLTPEQVAYMKKEIGKVYHATFPTAEALLQIALELIASNMFHMIVIDSLAAMETDAESEKTLDELSRGGISKTLSMFFKKLSGIHYDASIVMINQLRDNMDAGLYGKKYTIPGGRALKHGNALTIVLSSGERLKEKVNNKEVMYGKEINFIIDKGKAGCHDGGKGSYILYNGELGRPFGFDLEQDLLACGVFYDVIEQSGAWFSFENERLGQGKEASAELLRRNPDLAYKIKNEVFLRTNVRFITKE